MLIKILQIVFANLAKLGEAICFCKINQPAAYKADCFVPRKDGVAPL